MQELKNELLGRTFLQDGLKGIDKNQGIEKYGITNVKKLDDGFYSATFEGEPILIDTYLSVTEHGKGNGPDYTVLVIGIEEGKKNADLGMGSDGANSIYLFDKKRVKADKTDEVLEGVETWKALQSKAKGRLSEESAKALAGTYEQLDWEGKKAVHKYLQYLTFDVSSQVATLLGEMIEQVPLETYQDFKEVGFYSDAGKGGSSDDLFALKAACGLKQAGKDAKVLFKGGQFKDRAEIEKVVTEAIGEGKRDTDPKKQDLIDYLIKKLGKSREEANEAVGKTYNEKVSEAENIKNALAYKPKASYRSKAKMRY